MKGIILAGGSGTRLSPITIGVTKQLLPVYNKPLIYYPLSTLMWGGIREVLIICKNKDLNSFKELFGDGSQLGLEIEYRIQEYPGGIAEAFLIGEDFIAEDDVCLILGDNIFYGNNLGITLEENINHIKHNGGALIYGHAVNNPQDYGVAYLSKSGILNKIIEKPKSPRSNIAVVGLYMYDNTVVNISKSILPSDRGEKEITDVNRLYLNHKKIRLQLLGRGFAWYDSGSPEALFDASNFVKTIECRQGVKIACLEEIAFKKGFIGFDQLHAIAKKQKNSDYGRYLLKLVEEEENNG